MIPMRQINPILILGKIFNFDNETHHGSSFQSLYRDVREKIKILKNLANFDLPTEELNNYIQVT